MVGGRWSYYSALVFATREEAEDNAKHHLMNRRMLVEDSGAEETTDPVNYRWVGQKLVAIEGDER
jgi:ABC-type sulfate transport system substrate-binding protein